MNEALFLHNCLVDVESRLGQCPQIVDVWLNVFQISAGPPKPNAIIGIFFNLVRLERIREALDKKLQTIFQKQDHPYKKTLDDIYIVFQLSNLNQPSAVVRQYITNSNMDTLQEISEELESRWTYKSIPTEQVHAINEQSERLMAEVLKTNSSSYQQGYILHLLNDLKYALNNWNG